jgi:hypothetical protein
MDQFVDVAPTTEWSFNYFAPREADSERFTGKVSHNGAEMDVMIFKFKPEDLELYTETSDRLNSIYNGLNKYGGDGTFIDFFKSGVSNGYVYEARSVHANWQPLRQWLEEQGMIDGPSSKRKPFAEIEDGLRKIILRLFDFGQRLAWDHVTHGPHIDMFIINPLSYIISTNILNHQRTSSALIG